MCFALPFFSAETAEEHCSFCSSATLGQDGGQFVLPCSSNKQQMAGSMQKLLTWVRVRLRRRSPSLFVVQSG